MRKHRGKRNDFHPCGGGRLCTEKEIVTFKQGDAILIEKNEKYFWDAKAEVIMACSPAWTPEQHKMVK